jgi:hypothetical protein
VARTRELYRRVIGHLRKRLEATVSWAERRLESLGAAERGEGAAPAVDSAAGTVDTLGLSIAAAADSAGAADDGESTAEQQIWDDAAPRPLFDARELLEPLRVMHEVVRDRSTLR